jgi:thymidylate synthase (FAD)
MNTELPTELHSATLSWATPNGDDVIAYAARVSSPSNRRLTAQLIDSIRDDSTSEEDRIKLQEELNHLTSSLILGCIHQGHFSILEQASMAVHIKTTRAIAPQIIRHHSARFQEYSQRFAKVTEHIEFPEIRFINESGLKRDPSVPGNLDLGLEIRANVLLAECQNLYDDLIKAGVHSESARNFLPLCAPTVMSMTANMRDWVFYLKSRTSAHSQKEHQYLAKSIENLFREQYPITYNAYLLLS